MITLDENLAQHAAAGRISWETAKRFAKDASTMTDYVTPAKRR